MNARRKAFNTGYYIGVATVAATYFIIQNAEEKGTTEAWILVGGVFCLLLVVNLIGMAIVARR